MINLSDVIILSQLLKFFGSAADDVYFLSIRCVTQYYRHFYLAPLHGTATTIK